MTKQIIFPVNFSVNMGRGFKHDQKTVKGTINLTNKTIDCDFFAQGENAGKKMWYYDTTKNIGKEKLLENEPEYYINHPFYWVLQQQFAIDTIKKWTIEPDGAIAIEYSTLGYDTHGLNRAKFSAEGKFSVEVLSEPIHSGI